MNSEFRKNELRRLDINLLLVFLSLLKRRKAADTASDLGFSRSGVSQALRRLRDIFGDELFLRRSHGLEPTATALGLEEPITQAVEILSKAVGNAEPFAPITAQGTIRLGVDDVDQAVLIPELAKHLYQLAPGLRLDVTLCDSQRAVELLKQGSIDIALTPRAPGAPIPEKIHQTVLFQEDWLVVCQPETMDGPDCITPKTYATTPHIAINVDHRFNGLRAAHSTPNMSQKLDHCVALTVTGYFPALAVVARAGGLAIVPARLAQAFANNFGLCMTTPLRPPAPYRVCALWHARSQTDARLQWFLAQIKAVTSQQNPIDVSR